MSEALIQVTRSGYIKRTCRKCRVIRQKSYYKILFTATLVTTWPNGIIQHTAAVDNQVCSDAAAYDISRGAATAHCISNLDPASSPVGIAFPTITVNSEPF